MVMSVDVVFRSGWSQQMKFGEATSNSAPVYDSDPDIMLKRNTLTVFVSWFATIKCCPDGSNCGAVKMRERRGEQGREEATRQGDEKEICNGSKLACVTTTCNTRPPL